MALGAKALTAIILALAILSLTMLPTWSMAFLILLGMIASAVNRAVEAMEKKPILPVQDPAPAVDAFVDALVLPVVNRTVEGMEKKPILPVQDPAPAIDALVDAPALSIDAPVDASVDASALSVDAPVDARAPSVNAPVDAPALAEDAPALAKDSLALTFDAGALSVDASVDAPVDAPALAEDALASTVDAPLDASAQFPPVVAAGVRMRRKRKLVVKVDIKDNRDRSKAMRAVSALEWITSLTMDAKDNKLTVFGDFDPDKVVNRLRKSWHTDIVSVGAAKEDDG